MGVLWVLTGGKFTERTNTESALKNLPSFDYEDFLRQHSLPTFPPNHPALLRFKARRCQTLDEERQRSLSEAPEHPSLVSSTLAADATLSLLNLVGYLLDRQVARLAADFGQHGGFTERLCRTRRKRGY